MRDELIKFVLEHTQRGECKCGECSDVGTTPDPSGHTADMVFFKVAKLGQPTREDFIRLTKKCVVGNPFDGEEHDFMTLSGWLGSEQETALKYMALGYLLDVFDLFTPANMLPETVPQALKLRLAAEGLITVASKKKTF
jgi:hypothetical protein